MKNNSPDKRRKLRTVSISAAGLALVLVTVILINLIASQLTERFDLTLDLTANHMYEITDDTKKMLKSMDDTVEITVLASEEDFKNDSYCASVYTMLNKYRNLAGDRIQISYIDPYTNPNIIEKYSDLAASIQAYSVIVTCGDNTRVLNDTDFYATESNASYSGYVTATGFKGEQALTSAITTVTKEENPAVYILQGHNESISKSFTAMLTDAGFHVSLLNLTEEKTIPEDASMVVLSLPQADLTETEVNTIDAFVKQGGDFVVFDGTVSPTSMPTLYSYLKEWGAQVEADMVLDAEHNISAEADILAQITEENKALYGNDLALVTPNAKSITAGLPETVSDRTVTVLMESFDTSYAKILTDETQYDGYDKEDGDKNGPFALATLSDYTGNKNGGQVFVCSAGIMMSDDLMGAASLLNHSFFSNVISTMQPAVDVVSIPAKSLRAEPLITSTTAQFMIFLVLLLIPVIIMVTGIVIFVRRRKL